jgi:hypothetical protein
MLYNLLFLQPSKSFFFRETAAAPLQIGFLFFATPFLSVLAADAKLLLGDSSSLGWLTETSKIAFAKIELLLGPTFELFNNIHAGGKDKFFCREPSTG